MNRSRSLAAAICLAFVSPTALAQVGKSVTIVDANIATEQQLSAIGVGARMLREFKEYRPYNAMERFRREIGKYVDDKEVARLERYVTIN